MLRQDWWENTSGIIRFCFPKTRGTKLEDIRERLDQLIDWGFGAIDVFAPYLGSGEYGGLDVMDYYQVDPLIGTVDDFTTLIDAAHQKGLAVISSVNLGYGAMAFPVFKKACADIRAGVDSPETHWFLWSDTGKELLDKSLAPYFMNDTDGHWHYSEAAGKYYWVKWRGYDNSTELPQFNYGDPVLRDEIRRAIQFWLDKGLDGFILDAVSWYINCNWEINHDTLTGWIHKDGRRFVQPEGGGGFGDDPVQWITKGNYTCVQGYGLSILWNEHYVIGNAILAGNPQAVEEALQQYRDRVVAAGGVIYLGPRWGTYYSRNKSSLSPEQKRLEVACIISVGALFDADETLFELDWPKPYMVDLKTLVQALQATPALQAAGGRKRLVTNDDARYYALLRTSKDGKQQALAAMNFGSEPGEIVIRFEQPVTLKEILSTGNVETPDMPVSEVRLSLPRYGYGIYEMAPVF